jgi:hypothetical protein
MLNGEPVSPGAFDGKRIAPGGLAAENVLVVDAAARTRAAARGCTGFANPADGNLTSLT